MIAYENACRFNSARELAAIDGLTGIYNRRQFLELADLQFAAAAPEQPEQPAQAAIMIDVDHFKTINDGHGHHVGDEVLREIAKRVRSTVRETDLAGRVGGEEFAVFLAPGADASRLAERIRIAVSATPTQTSGGPIGATVSVGCTYRRNGDSNVGAVLARADAALYEAKRLGRDRIVQR
jgi:diguanylate cyclase (GGDEF)-like protein